MQPDNPKLFNSLEQQAAAKYPKRRGVGISPAAGKWLHEQYLKSGGGYVSSKKDIDPKNRDFKDEEKKKAKEKEKRRKKNLKARGFVA
jgi:hypothetical protein